MWDCYFKLYDYIYFSVMYFQKHLWQPASSTILVSSDCYKRNATGWVTSTTNISSSQFRSLEMGDRGVGWLGSGEGVFLIYRWPSFCCLPRGDVAAGTVRMILSCSQDTECFSKTANQGQKSCSRSKCRWQNFDLQLQPELKSHAPAKTQGPKGSEHRLNLNTRTLSDLPRRSVGILLTINGQALRPSNETVSPPLPQTYFP